MIPVEHRARGLEIVDLGEAALELIEARFGHEHGEVVDDVHALHGHGIHAAVHVDQLGAISIRIVDELGDNVVIRNGVAAATDEETRANRRFGGGTRLDYLNLHHAIGVPTEHVGCRDGSLLREEAAGRTE